MTNLTTEVFSYYNDFDYSDADSFNNLKLDNAYVPNFIFQHLKSNLIVDIEIDEPYTYGKPIHAYDNNSDRKRNEYFTSLNWFVIRFSERQILTDPLSCCFELALLVKDYTGDNSYFVKLHQSKEVSRDKMWNTNSAKNYALMDFRRTYTKLITEPLNEKSIVGEWTFNGKKYEIEEGGKITEKKIISKEIVDEGNYVVAFRDCGRLIMSVKWKNNQTKYLLNLGWDNSIILTDLYSRDQISFERFVN